MWPWGHLGVAYLVYRAYLTYVVPRDQRRLAAGVVIAVVVGSQFPDLIDKPLAWTFAVLPSGRSLAHSLLTLAVVGWIVVRLADTYGDRAYGVAFVVGAVSHSLSDLGPGVVVGLLQGDLSQLAWTTYLLWPVLASPPYPSDNSFISHFADFVLTPYVAAQFLLFAVAVGLWLRDGRPGYNTVRRRLLAVVYGQLV
jgi:hypothetical protein